MEPYIELSDVVLENLNRRFFKFSLKRMSIETVDKILRWSPGLLDQFRVFGYLTPKERKDMPFVTQETYDNVHNANKIVKQILDITTEETVRKLAVAFLYPSELERLRYENEELKKQLADRNNSVVEDLPSDIDSARRMAFGLCTKAGYDTTDASTMRNYISFVTKRPVLSRKSLTLSEWHEVIKWLKKVNME